MTFKTLLSLIRIAVAVLGVGLGVLMLGPFQGLERSVGLTDLQAHAAAFFAMTLLAYVVAPDRRRGDLSLAMFGIGILIELAQVATGRSISLSDVLANGLGVAAAYVPALIEQLRRLIRLHPDAAVSSLATLERRRQRGTGTVPQGPPIVARLSSE